MEYTVIVQSKLKAVNAQQAKLAALEYRMPYMEVLGVRCDDPPIKISKELKLFLADVDLDTTPRTLEMTFAWLPEHRKDLETEIKTLINQYGGLTNFNAAKWIKNG